MTEGETAVQRIVREALERKKQREENIEAIQNQRLSEIPEQNEQMRKKFAKGKFHPQQLHQHPPTIQEVWKRRRESFKNIPPTEEG